jgi:hypothetical protein
MYRQNNRAAGSWPKSDYPAICGQVFLFLRLYFCLPILSRTIQEYGLPYDMKMAKTAAKLFPHPKAGRRGQKIGVFWLRGATGRLAGAWYNLRMTIYDLRYESNGVRATSRNFIRVNPTKSDQIQPVRESRTRDEG